MYIDKNSNVPAYCQLKKIILNKIQNGEFKEECPIPSERSLSEMMQISRMTVRQALNQLVYEGVLFREHGRGTFVSKVKFEQRNIMSFSEIVKQNGMEASTRILSFEIREAEELISTYLHLIKNEKVYNLKRLRLANKKPIGIEEVFIPQKYCPGLEKKDLTTSLYGIMKNKYDYYIHFVDYVIEAVKPSEEEKILLEIEKPVSVLVTKGINYIEADTRLLYERSAYRSDEYKYSARIYMN